MDTIIEVKDLTRRFGHFTAVDSITFQVMKGEIFAFLGPNGAGKSTTIKILITLLKPTSGKALVNGHDVVAEPGAVREVIGYVPQMISVDGTLTAYENLMLMARLFEIPRKERKRRVERILQFLQMEQQAHALVRTFSGGMIRKLEVGQAIIHYPAILFLDEPTTGLDPVARQSVWQHLLELRKDYETTIFFSTHYMEEADEVSDHVAVMNEGKIAAIGPPAELKEKTGKPNATLEDVFVFFTGSEEQLTGSFREVQRMRRQQRRLR